MLDLKSYIKSINQNREQFINLLNKVDESFLDKKINESWTMLEIAEHIYKVERTVIIGLKKPSENIHSTNEIYGSEKLNRIIIGLRSKKIIAPAAFEPNGVFSNKEIAIEKFNTMRNKWTEELFAGKIIIDHRKVAHPFLGDLTMSDWLHFILLHSQRHYMQMQDLMIVFK